MLANPRTFPCPNCKEIINESMTQCRYCSVPVDPAVAQLIAGRQEKANQAYSDASFLRTSVIAMYVFLFVSWFPFLPFMFWGFVITFVVVLVLLIRWQVRYSSLITSDVDFKRARRSWWVAFVLFLGVPLLVTFEFVLARLSRG
jgi:hypothetical protein